MKLLLYLNSVKYILLFNLPLGVLGTFYGVRDFTTYLVLVPLTLLDFFFIITNYKDIAVRRLEVYLLVSILLSLFIGIGYSESFSRRHFSDFFNPFLFILKVAVLRSLIPKTRMDYMHLFGKLSSQLFLSGVISIFLFYFLSSYRNMYIGLTPTTHPFFILSLLKGNTIGQILSLILIVFSGKRALLISSMIIYLICQIIILRKIKVIIKLATVILFLTGLFEVFNVISFSAFEKYKWTYDLFIENKDNLSIDNEFVDIITAGRKSEFEGAIKSFKPVDYIFGKGVGFTYSYFSMSENETYEGYGNLHFTPLSLITKYGSIFYVGLVFYMFIYLSKFNLKNKFLLAWSLYIVASFVDMFFAFTIFVDPLIPIGLGFLTITKTNDYAI